MLSLQMYTLRHSMKTRKDLVETLRRVAEMGYESVQITPPAFLDVAEDDMGILDPFDSAAQSLVNMKKLGFC